MRKFKLKGRKESYQDDNKLTEGSGKVELADIKMTDKPKKGKIIIRKKKGKADRKTEEDATNDEAQIMLEKSRLKNEKKIGDIIRGLK